jgi:hypothetical protein
VKIMVDLLLCLKRTHGVNVKFPVLKHHLWGKFMCNGKVVPVLQQYVWGKANLFNCTCNCICIVFIVCSVSVIVCVVLCVVFVCVMCVIRVLCLIVVPLPPDKNPFAV